MSELTDEQRAAVVAVLGHDVWCDYDEKLSQGCTADFGCDVWRKAGALAPLIARMVADAEKRGRVEGLRPLDLLFSGGPDTHCRTVWRELNPGNDHFAHAVECVEVPLSDLRDAFDRAYRADEIAGDA